MGLARFLQFVVTYSVDVFAWPLLALAYPLCASVRAIETNSVLDTRKLNTYWVIFSLILLLEHALSLFEWFPFWPYLRLIIVCLLVIPYFDGAFYVYKQVTCSLFSMDVHIIINWFTKPKEASVEMEKILTEVEKYVRENGTEDLEKIIASKHEKSWVREKVLSSANNKGVKQPNFKGPHEAREDIKTVEVIEKNQVTAAAQVSSVEPKLTQSKDRTSLHAETREKEFEVQTPVSKPVQKEWACALCQVTTQSAEDFISHLQSKKHKGKMNEAADAKNQPVFPQVLPSYSPKKSYCPAEVDPGKGSNDQTVFPKVVFSHIPKISCQSTDEPLRGNAFAGFSARVITSERLEGKAKNVVPASSASQSSERNEETKRGPANGEVNQKSGIKRAEKRRREKAKNQKNATVVMKDLPLWCTVCNIRCSGKGNMQAHLRGQKHLNKVKLLAEKYVA